MKFGISSIPTDNSVAPQILARAIEDRGFESYWCTEHSHIPVERRTPYPAGGELPEAYKHSLDPFVALAAAATHTSKLKLGTAVCLLLQRDAIITAKECASVDWLSGGRLIFGVAGGWNAEELANHGTPFSGRFAKLREQVSALKEIWSHDEAQFHGKHVSFDAIWSWPKPVQKPHPPILLGGMSEHCLQRVVDYCDGWLPVGAFSQDYVLAGMRDLRQRAERAGRDPRSVSTTVYDTPTDRRTIERYQEAGVERLILVLPPGPRDEILPRLDTHTHLLDAYAR